MKRRPLSERRAEQEARALTREPRPDLAPGAGQCEHLYLRGQCPYCVIQDLRIRLDVSERTIRNLRTDLRRKGAK